MLLKGVKINIARLEEPLLLISDEDILLFQQLMKPILDFQLVECHFALSTKKSISLIRDIWLAMYKDRDKLFINSEHAMLYPIRLLLFELVSEEEYFKRLAKKSRDDECLSLLYAIIYLQFVLQWLEERFRGNKQICTYMKVLFPTTEDDKEDDYLTISREKTVAQALIVKAIRFEVQNNMQEFSSLLFQTYNSIEYLHEKMKNKNDIGTRVLPSMRNVADILNTFYSQRYTTNKADFTG